MTHTAKKVHILIVDDDHIVCAVLAEILKRFGYQSTCLYNGKKALAFLKKNPYLFDLIILDRIMPELSGIDVLYQLYTIPVIKNIPVIMLSSNAERSHVKAAMTYGAHDFIYKPIDETILRNSILRALASSKIKSSHEFA